MGKNCDGTRYILRENVKIIFFKTQTPKNVLIWIATIEQRINMLSGTEIIQG